MGTTPISVCVVVGTRPEVVKLAPVIRELSAHPARFKTTVITTGQHRSMAQQLLDAWEIHPDYNCDVMVEGQSLSQLASAILSSMDTILSKEKPEVLIVQGDTNSVLAAAMCGFYRKIPVAHVEAGIRSGNIHNPFPEEMNRVLTARMASLHFAPTENARKNLLREGIDPTTISVTGNTVVDSLLAGLRDPRTILPNELTNIESRARDIILVTTHRRENIGTPLKNICRALKSILERNVGCEIVLPVHLNPEVQRVVRGELGGHDRVNLTSPLNYHEFLAVLRISSLIATDSGGVQEEAISLGKPVLLLRDVPDRVEDFPDQLFRAPGTNQEQIVEDALTLLQINTGKPPSLAASGPFGDGKAAAKIAHHLSQTFRSNG